jgi:rSAM/selenodomain-associated transferase 2
MKISIIVPVLNEAAIIRKCLEKLQELESEFELIIADGGSSDETITIVKQFISGSKMPCIVLENMQPGRAYQMNGGAEVSQGEVLLFLHADCKLEKNALLNIENRLHDQRIIGGGFYKKYSKENLPLWFYRAGMNLIRTKLLRNLVGTNAIFIRRDRFFELGAFPEVALLEDVMLSDRMKKSGELAFLKPHVVSSSRRYYAHGILKRIWIASRIMYLYRFRNVAPDELKRIYQQMSRSLTSCKDI